MTILTKSEFARQAGVSRQAVAYAGKHGKLVFTDGKVDTTLDMNRFYLHKNQKSKVVKNSTPFAKRKDQPSMQRVANGDYDADLAELSFNEAARIEKIEKVMKLRVETAAKRGDLLDKEMVKVLLMKLFAVHTGELHPLGDKIAQDLGAVFENTDETKTTKIREIVDKHMFKTLGHIKRLMNDFCQEKMDELVIKEH